MDGPSLGIAIASRWRHITDITSLLLADAMAHRAVTRRRDTFPLIGTPSFASR